MNNNIKTISKIFLQRMPMIDFNHFLVSFSRPSYWIQIFLSLRTSFLLPGTVVQSFLATFSTSNDRSVPSIATSANTVRSLPLSLLLHLCHMHLYKQKYLLIPCPLLLRIVLLLQYPLLSSLATFLASSDMEHTSAFASIVKHAGCEEQSWMRSLICGTLRNGTWTFVHPKPSTNLSGFLVRINKAEGRQMVVLMGGYKALLVHEGIRQRLGMVLEKHFIVLLLNRLP